MTDLFSTLGALISSLGNVQSAAVARDHVALLKSELDIVKLHLKELERENGELKATCHKLEVELFRKHPPAEFVEQRGALFKRLAGGGYSDTPVCPVCKRTMATGGESFFPYTCSNPTCGHWADFTGDELAAVMQGLPK